MPCSEHSVNVSNHYSFLNKLKSLSGTVLGAGDIAVSNTGKVPELVDLVSLVGVGAGINEKTTNREYLVVVGPIIRMN